MFLTRVTTCGASVFGAIANLRISELADDAPAYMGRSKLEALLGAGIWDELAGRTVLDFGCGPGVEAVEMAERGAARVVGVDIREEWLHQARTRATEARVSERCTFTQDWSEPVDTIVCVDGFEHFSDPAWVLRRMHGLLRKGGRVIVTFGPPWMHPLGGHLYSVFPFAHLLVPDAVLVRWRSTFKPDRAPTMLRSGLNKMTVRRFERMVAASPFQFEGFDAVPIRRLRRLANRVTREFTTSVVRCRLVAREA
jgi:ubiquinone/menaquinone biosynthesis C-methylase UbiE